MILTEAIVVRISHDLAGAAGAFANTIDLMKMDASFIGESIDLLDTSARQLTARLAFFRALFGAETKSISPELVQRYLATLAIPVEFKGDISSRLQLALVAVGLELLSIGGTLNLNDKNLTIKGQELHHDPSFVQILMGMQMPCDPKTVMADWLVQMAKEENLSVRLDSEDDQIIISLI